MAYQRNPSQPAGAACNVHPHPDCSACHAPILRRAEHVHHYRRGTIWSSLCGECVAIEAAAALPICEAAERCGIPTTVEDLQKWLNSGNVGILISTPLPLD